MNLIQIANKSFGTFPATFSFLLQRTPQILGEVDRSYNLFMLEKNGEKAHDRYLSLFLTAFSVDMNVTVRNIRS